MQAGGRRFEPDHLHHGRNVSCDQPTGESAAFAGGGGERDRTDDLLLAKQALSQLSYTPFSEAGDQRSEIKKEQVSPHGGAAFLISDL